MDIAVPLANNYTEEFGYHAIAIAIENSQMWDRYASNQRCRLTFLG